MRSTQLLITLVLWSYLAAAQDVGLLTSVKGTVVVKKSSGQSQRASVKDALSVGDEVATANGASATIMYYTGKEVYLSSNKTYVVAKEGKEDTFLTRLANVFSNLLWSKQKTKSVLGASRGFDAKVNPGITGIYPRFTVARGPVLPFEWSDTRSKSGGSYIVTLRNEKGAVEKSLNISDANRVLLPIARLDLVPGAKYRWQVRDRNSNLASKEILFTFLPDTEKDRLEQSRQRLKDFCKNDTTQFRYTLLEAMLYLDSDLIMQAESSLSDLVKLKPEFAVGHEMLADVFKKVGKIDEANAELKTVQALLEAK